MGNRYSTLGAEKEGSGNLRLGLTSNPIKHAGSLNKATEFSPCGLSKVYIHGNVVGDQIRNTVRGLVCQRKNKKTI